MGSDQRVELEVALLFGIFDVKLRELFSRFKTHHPKCVVVVQCLSPHESNSPLKAQLKSAVFRQHPCPTRIKSINQAMSNTICSIHRSIGEQLGGAFCLVYIHPSDLFREF